MRATASEALDGTAVISTQAFVSDGGGGGSTTWTPSGTVDCRLAPFGQGRGGEQTAGDRLHPDSTFVFTFPADTVIDHNARIAYGGETFEVTGVRTRSTEMTTRVEAKETE